MDRAPNLTMDDSGFTQKFRTWLLYPVNHGNESPTIAWIGLEKGVSETS